VKKSDIFPYLVYFGTVMLVVGLALALAVFVDMSCAQNGVHLK
jgi:hypothetical protein